MSADAAPAELAGNFLEWRLIEDEKDALAERSKELFKAMKDRGFDTKAARAAFRNKRAALDATAVEIAKAEEDEAIGELYRVALDQGLEARAHPARHARENIEKFPPHDAITGELADEGSQGTPQTPDTSLAAREGDESAAPHCQSDDFDPGKITFLRKTAADYRPHCQHPEVCAASGLRHCNQCQRAIDDADGYASASGRAI